MRVTTKYSIWLAIFALALVCALGEGRFAHGQAAQPAAGSDLNTDTEPDAAANSEYDSRFPDESDRSSPSPMPPGPTASSTEIPEKAEPSAGLRGNSAQAGSRKVREELPLFYARDKQGNLVPLLGFSYEELLEFSKQKHSLLSQAQHKRAAIGQLVISGDVQGDRAELTAKYVITVDKDDWMQVPVLVQGAVLLEPAVYHGKGKHSVEFDAKTGTYSLRLRAEPKSVNELTLKLAAPIKNIGAERRLELDLPTAAASHFVLRVPVKGITIAGHQGATTVEINKQNGDESTIEAWGIGGVFSVSWNPSGAKAAASSALESTGQILARIDSRSVQFDARLTVRSLSGEFDRFRVKLPPGAQWIPIENTSAAGYSVKLAENSTTNSKSPVNQVVEVRLAQNTVGPVDVQLKAERAHDVVRSTESLELAGFEILEAVPHRQWGTIAVAVVGDWRVVWGKLDRVRQIADLPSNMPRKDLVAGFEYFGQASLPARLTARKTRILVEPQYTYHIEGRKIRLVARLKYAIRGAKAFSLDLEIPGWTIDEIGPSGLTDIDAVLSDDGSISTIILTQATIGDEEIVLHAHRELPADASSVEFAIPVPHADVVSPATVAIHAADNLRLMPRELQMQGLVRQAASNALIPNDQLHAGSPTLTYRAEQLPAVFAADIERLSQTVASGTENAIELVDDEVRVEQRFNYQVEHEPMDSIRLDVPRTLVNDPSWRLTVFGEPLLVTPTGPAEAERIPVEILLDEPRMGSFQVVSQFKLPQTQLVSGASVLADIPLIVPLDGASTVSKMSIATTGAIRVQMRDDLWSIDPEGKSAFTGARPALHFMAEHPDEKVELALSMEDRRGLGETTIERCWVQSWIGNSVRQDRAVYRFTSTNEKLQIALPSGLVAGNLEVRLNGEIVTAQESPAGSISLFLPDNSNGMRHLLELRYLIDLRERRTSTTEIEFPQFNGTVWIQRMFWQLALPDSEHLVYSPVSLTPEYAWQWNGLFWQRNSRMDQKELEQWTASEPGTDLPIATNQYLFSVTGPISSVTIQSASRWELVAWASASALAAGLLFIYLPVIRRSWLFVVVAVVLAGLAVWQSSIALLVAQAAGAGIALAILAGLIERLVSRRQQLPVVVRSAGSSIVDRGSTRPQPRYSESPIVPSTDVVPVDLESSSVHSTTG